MERIKSSELILNKKGNIYHLDLSPEMIANDLLVMGDPSRVGDVSKRLDSIEFDQTNREFRTVTGRVGTKRLTLLSHGIGTDNIDIVINELDALVNIDLESKVVKKDKTSLKIVRLGTTGALQPEIELGSILKSEYAIGLDNLMWFYPINKLDEDLQNSFMLLGKWEDNLPKPYAVKCSNSLSKKYKELNAGITLTASGFYGPQGRELRLKSRIKERIENALTLSYNGLKITNFEMETSGLYGLCALLEHESITLCAAIANRSNGTFLTDYQSVINELIENAFSGLTN